MLVEKEACVPPKPCNTEYQIKYRCALFFEIDEVLREQVVEGIRIRNNQTQETEKFLSQDSLLQWTPTQHGNF